ncbi:unnamed protein product [Moneuplotes crassus]|uniref:Uncharacterized protein n=1 Tax=Euplotes crassus TaxID=5936 RepID=A0AAD1UJ12_EUPCR|nr:unnamed protein product [Moneuplotes crassus]
MEKIKSVKIGGLNADMRVKEPLLSKRRSSNRKQRLKRASNAPLSEREKRTLRIVKILESLKPEEFSNFLPKNKKNKREQSLKSNKESGINKLGLASTPYKEFLKKDGMLVSRNKSVYKDFKRDRNCIANSFDNEEKKLFSKLKDIQIQDKDLENSLHYGNKSKRISHRHSQILDKIIQVSNQRYNRHLKQIKIVHISNT